MVGIRKVSLHEIEDQIARHTFQLGVHGDFAEEVFRLRDGLAKGAQSVPQVVERVHAFGERLGGLVVGLHEGASQLDGIGQVFVDKLLRIPEEFTCWGIDMSTVR